MGNVCFRAKHQRLQRNFNEGIVLRPDKAHSENSESVKVKRTTLLGGATLDSHLTCLAALIDAGADVNERLPYGHTALHFHPLQNKLSDGGKLGDAHIQCFKLLIEKGADVNISDQVGQLPLHKAAEVNHPNCLELFIL